MSESEVLESIEYEGFVGPYRVDRDAFESGSVNSSLMLNRSSLSLGSPLERLCSAVVVAIDLALGVGFNFFDFGIGLDFGSQVRGTCEMNFIEIGGATTEVLQEKAMS
jgi:hypothetical protein